jgi:small GTP-binding protein
MSAIKVSLMGEANVGKTTLVNLLNHQPLNGPRKPTIGVSVEKVELNDDVNIAMWDLAGQRRFQFMWDQFNQGSSITMVVTDSTPQNVLLTKNIIESHLTNRNGSKVIAIANKQDLEGRMKPEEIQAALGVPTYGLVATERMNDALLRNILEKTLRE